ncbi:MAG: type II secretion system F family protein [Verrucomicrobiota bacterium]
MSDFIDPLFIGVVAVTVLFFVVMASALAALFGKKEKKTVKSRVEKMREVADELKGELAPAREEKKKESILSGIDLKPTLDKLAGEGYFARLEVELAKADIPMRVSEFIIFRLLMAFIVAGAAYILSRNVFVGAGVLVVLLFIHIPLIKIMQGMRVKKFTNQLADFLVLIVNSLRAGQTFIQGCSVAVAESPDPVASEFKQVIKEVNLGMPEAESMENMLRRVPSEDLKIVVSAYLIQRKVGGNLAEIFETTANTIRERIKIQGKINALTTQGKLSGILVGVLPFLLGIVLTLINPDYMAPLTSTIPGYIAIGLGLAFQITGFTVIWKIVNIDI